MSEKSSGRTSIALRRIRVLRMAGERSHRAAAVEQALRDGATAVAERAGHDVDWPVLPSVRWSSLRSSLVSPTTKSVAS